VEAGVSGADEAAGPAIVVEEDGPVRIVSLNRPRAMNALDRPAHRALTALWHQLSLDPGARAVILTGKGRSFNAGADVGDFLDAVRDPAVRKEMVDDGRRLIREMIGFPLPVVAAVNGPAIGLGCSLALLSDIIFMSEQASLADTHVSLGFVAGDGGALMWPLMTSMCRAKEYLWSGDPISATLAVELGLANRVLPAESLLPEAMAFAHRLAALPPQAVQGTKRALHGHIAAVDRVLDYAVTAEEVSFLTPEVAAQAARLRERFSPDRERS
jgi:enoyl-CoA hydratase